MQSVPKARKYGIRPTSYRTLHQESPGRQGFRAGLYVLPTTLLENSNKKHMKTLFTYHYKKKKET